MTDQPNSSQEATPAQVNAPNSSDAMVASRRRLLKLGAIAAPAVITLASGPAAAAASVTNCHVIVPQYLKLDQATGRYVAGDALDFVAQDTDGIVRGSELATPGAVPDSYVQYISNLSPGQGRSCLSSVLPS
jgi:hypothetical protein